MNCETGKWYDCNDSWVKSISGHDSESSSAYVLFYVIKGGQVKVSQ
jgi:ubiquitin C-terminal hydrolase